MTKYYSTQSLHSAWQDLFHKLSESSLHAITYHYYCFLRIDIFYNECLDSFTSVLHIYVQETSCADILPCSFQVFASLGLMSPSIVNKFKQNAKEKEERNILRLLLCIHFQYVLQSIVFECSAYLSPKKKKFSLRVNHGQENWQQWTKTSLQSEYTELHQAFLHGHLYLHGNRLLVQNCAWIYLHGKLRVK